MTDCPRKTAIALMSAALLLSPVSLAASLLNDMNFNTTTGNLDIQTSQGTRATINTLNVSGNKRVIVDLENAEIGDNLPDDMTLLSRLAGQWRPIRNISINQFGGATPVVRILLDLDGTAYTPQLTKAQGTHVLVKMTGEATAALPAEETTVGPAPDISTETFEEPEPDRMPDRVTSPAIAAATAPMTFEDAAPAPQFTAAPAQPAAAVASDELLLREELNNARRESAALKEIAGQVAPMKAELTRLREANQSLQQQLFEKPAIPPASLSTIQTQLDDAKTALKDSITTINTQNKEIAQLKKEVARLQLSASSAEDNQVTALNSTLEKRNAEIQQLRESLSAANQAVKENAGPDEAMVRELETAQQTLAQQSREIGDLKTQIAQLSMQPAASQNEAKTLSRELKALQAQHKSAVATFNQDRAEADKALASANARIATLEQQVTAQPAAEAPASPAENKADKKLAKENATLQKRLTEAYQQIATLETQVKDAAGTAGTQNSPEALAEQKASTLQLATLREENAALKKAAEAGQKSIQKLSDGMSALEKRNADLQGELEALNRDNQTLAKAAKAPESEKPAREDRKAGAQLKTLQAKLQETEAALTKLQSANTELTATNQSLKQSLSAQAKTMNATTNAPAKKSPGATESTATEAVALTNTTSEPGSLDEARSYYDKGASLEAGLETQSALEAYRQAARLAPNENTYVFAYANALATQGNPQDAVDLIQKYINRNPGDFNAYNQLGKLYLMSDQLEAAKSAFANAIPINALNNYASTLKKLDQVGDAENFYRMALALRPSDTDLMFNLGNLYSKTNRLSEARTQYEDALKLKPEFAEAHYNLGLVYSKMGSKEDAITHLERFLQLNPNAKNADIIQSYVNKLRG
ncbi:MAG: tetratricopeptide repeat protein [Candidatus Melainabacteria bacterium]